MLTRYEQDIRRKWGILEAEAEKEIGLAHRATDREEQHEHYINAIVAENTASWLVGQYRADTELLPEQNEKLSLLDSEGGEVFLSE